MKGLRRFLSRAWGFLIRRDDQRLQDEIEEHLALQTAANIKSGMSNEEARRQAVLKFGAVEAVREALYAEQGLPLLEEFARDLQYAFRLLIKSPRFAFAAIITLGLGVGVISSLFSLIYALGIRYLPVKDASTLVSIYQQYRGQVHSRGVYGSPYYLSYPEYLNYRDHVTAFSGLAAYAEVGLALSGSAPEPIAGQLVSCNYFHVLEASMSIGRVLTSGDCGNQEGPVAVLSHRFWQKHFGMDKNLVGKAITVDGHSVTVIGVVEPDFFGTELQVPDVWLPVTMAPQLLPATFGSRTWPHIGRNGHSPQRTNAIERKGIAGSRRRVQGGHQCHCRNGETGVYSEREGTDH